MQQKILLTGAFIFISLLNGFGQETISREQEREIKTSGNYYFGEGTSFDEVEAKTNALNQLMRVVIVSLVQQSIQTEKNEDLQKKLEIQAKIAKLPLTGRIRILAWIAKDNINMQGESINIPAEVRDLEPQPQSSIVSVTTEQKATSTPVPEKPTIVNPVIQDLATSKTLNEFSRKVTTWRRQGKEVIYGRKSSFAYPDKCYIAVFSTSGTLIAMLDTGSQSRTDLLTGNITQNPEQHYRGNDLRWIEIR